jgi:RNA polymerase sigma-70 factor (ECF subfamily)
MDVDDVAREYFARIHRAALVLTGSPWDADDLAQETFLVLARDPDKYQGRSSIYTWLYGILLNLERRQRRQAGTHRRKLKVVHEESTSRTRTAPAAETAVEVSEWKNSLWNQVACLPDGQRQVLVLRFSEGLRLDEIAEVLGCPLGTVKSRIFHGLRRLRDLMEQQDEELCLAPKHPHEDQSNVI